MIKPRANKDVKELREWAATRCLSATQAPNIPRPTQLSGTAPLSTPRGSLDSSPPSPRHDQGALCPISRPTPPP